MPNSKTPRSKTIVSGASASRSDQPTETGENPAANNLGGSIDALPGFVAAASGQLLGYARVSTASQVHDRQIDALTAEGCARIFQDVASGSKASRPELDALLAFARPGDTVVVLALDRLGRDTRQLLAWIDELRERDIGLRIIQLGVDTSTPAGKMVLSVIASLAEMESAVLRSRVREGLAAAKLRGRVGGRPASLSPAQKIEVRRLHSEGRPPGEIAALFGCSPRTVHRAVSDAARGEPSQTFVAREHGREARC